MKMFFLVVVALGLLIGCSRQKASVDKLQVFVSIAPQSFFVEKVAGSRVAVSVLLPPGASPHSYEPRPSQMAELSKAQLYFTVGVEFENAWIPRIRQTSSRLRVVSTDSGLAKIDMAVDEHSSHHEQCTGDHHDHGGLDPHVWLSPTLVKQQVSIIAQALSSVDPAHAREYDVNLRNFLLSIDSLSMRIRSGIDSAGIDRFMVFHPSWGYFAHEFGLRQISIEVEGKEPSPRELGEILTLARKEAIKTIFVQPQFSSKSAQTLARELDCVVAEADPLARDWDSNLLSFAHALRRQ